MQIAPGTRLGRYEIRSKLGAGGMGEVYLAEDTQLRRQVALKILSADLASHNDRMRRFVQEAQAAAALNHPNIAHIYEIGETGGVNFIAMEFIEGQTFRRLIHGREPDSKKVLRCLRQVAEGLAKAHAAGIVHRDLKPDNIMITNDGFAKILDFGLAKLVESQRPLGLSSDPFLPLLTIITHTVMTTASLVAAPRTTAISGSGALVVAGTFFHAYKKTGALPQSPAASVTPNEFGTYCFDLKGKQLWADKFKGYEGVYCVAMSDDGTIAASGGWDTNHPLAGFVRAYSTKNGTQLFNYLVAGSRINALALSADGTTLVGGADNLYSFQQKKGVFSTTPSILKLSGKNNNVQAVSISADGTSIVIGDAQGTVSLVENKNGKIGDVYPWRSDSLKTVHSVAIAADGGWFAAVGSSKYVYLFSTDSIKKGKYFAVYDLGNVVRAGWVAISAAGDFISAVCNQGKAGLVYGLQNRNQELALLWSKPQPTLANPNSTSVDFKGKYVTVADGYPDGTPGHFYLFDGPSGDLLWQYKTSNMSWPMFISSNGSGIVAGSDQGSVYYFKPA